MIRQPSLSVLTLPLAVVAVIAAAIVCSHTVTFLYNNHTDIPNFDQWALWNTLDDVLHKTVLPFTALFASNN